MPGTAETETAAIPSMKKSDNFIALCVGVGCQFQAVSSSTRVYLSYLRALARLTDENEQRCEALNGIQTCLTSGPSEPHFI